VRHLDANVHEPPARPRSVLMLDALPVTAVGKIFKPALRDLAIEEKVRLELARICGSGATARVDVQLDARKRTVVGVAVSGATTAQLDALAQALRPLPQSYSVTSAG
jgi:fatty-acyl-CoA synthase